MRDTPSSPAPTAGRSRPLASRSAPRLKARTHYPTVSLVRLRTSPLRKLAWVFGFGR